MRYVLLYRDEEGHWIADVPSLPGCHSDGETRDDALIRVREAVELWTDDAKEYGEDIPPEFDAPELASIYSADNL